MPPPTPHPSAADDAIAGANVPPSSPSSPSSHSSLPSPRRVSYAAATEAQSNIRKAQEHATPAKGCGSPIKKAGRRSESITKRTPRDVELFVPTATSLADPSPAIIHPPAPTFVTQSQSSSPSESSSGDATAVPTITPATTKAASKKKGTTAKATRPTTKKTKAQRAGTRKGEKKKTNFGNRKVKLDNTIWEWMRDGVFEPESAHLNDAEMELFNQRWDSFQKTFPKQINWRFQRKVLTNDERGQMLGRGLRSSVEEDLLLDDDAATANTTNIQRTSRYHLEDLFRMREGERLVLYFRYNKTWINKQYSGIPFDAGEEQQQSNIGGDVMTIGGKKFLALKATIYTARQHEEIQSGAMSLSRLSKLYDEKDGFIVQFDGTDHRLTLSWKSVIEDVEDLYFFGPALDGSRTYIKQFERRSNPVYLRMIYMALAKETYGDVITSSALTIAYHRRLEEVQAAEIEQLRHHDPLLKFNETSTEATFLNVFDKTCRRVFYHTMTNFRNLNECMLHPDCFDTFVELAERFMPRLWSHMCSVRNVKGDRHKEDKQNIFPRKRQVFQQILLLIRMRNPKKLIWWSMIQACAFFGWSVGRTALNASSTWGMVCSSPTRDRLLGKLTANLTQRQTKFFTGLDSVLFCIDNYEERVKSMHQRGGHSARQFSGTHEIAHRIRPYNDTTHDGIHCPISYTVDQDYPSPVLMPAIELQAEKSKAEFLFNFKSMQPGSAPCDNGQCVRSHVKHVRSNRWITEMHRVFATLPRLPTCVNLEGNKQL